MKKQIKQYGNTKIIRLTKEECDAYGWKLDDFVEVLSLNKMQLSDKVKISFKDKESIDWAELKKRVNKDE